MQNLSVCSASQWRTTHLPWGCNLRSNAETYLYALPISEKQHIHPEDATRDQMQRLICTLCLSVKSNTLTLRIQHEIKCRHFSVCSANQWKATHPPWGCNSRSNAETYLYALPISGKQHIQLEDANKIFFHCQLVKSNTSPKRIQLEIRDLSLCSANQ